MEVKYWSDGFGNHFKEIISRKYVLLKELADEFLKRGATRTELRVFDVCEGKWMLTVTESSL